MELDKALAFFVVATAALSGVAAIRAKAWRWLGVQIANVAIVGAAWFFAHAWFVEIVAPIWLATVLAPSLATSGSDRFTRAERFGIATALARVAAALHPTPATRLRFLLAAAQRAEQTGRREELPALLGRLGAAPGGATLARLLELRLDNRWQDIREWLESQPGLLGTDPVALTFLLRAQGELGDVDALVRTLGIAQTTPPFAAIEGQALLFATSFGGKEPALEAVLDAFHAEMPETTRSLWRLTAARAAGKDVDAELRALTQSDKPRLAALARVRLEAPRPEPSHLTQIALGTLAERVAKLEPARVPRPSATAVIVAINAYVFLRELSRGSSTSDDNLLALGALQTDLVGDPAEWYRFFTATVLHAGWAHVTMNMLGLIVLGRPLEAAVGRWRFVAIYLLAGLGANVLYVPFTHLMHKAPEPVVGASGCVMAVAGALLVRRIVRWRERRTRIARGEVIWLLVLLVVQTAFDQTQDNVAGSVHLFGAGLGALLALVLGRPKRAPPQPTTRARIVALAAVVAGALGMEAIWATAAPRGDAKACVDGSLDACRRNCRAALEARGRRPRFGFDSCARAASELRELDLDSRKEAIAIWAAMCDAGERRACPARASDQNNVDVLTCGRGDTDACKRACVHVFGSSILATPPEAAAPTTKGIERLGSVYACVRFADELSTRPGAADDDARAYVIYAAACDAGNGEACAKQGDALAEGSGVARDDAAAMRLYGRACDAGEPGACATWAMPVLHDGGFAEGRAALEYACDAGNADGCAALQHLRDLTR